MSASTSIPPASTGIGTGWRPVRLDDLPDHGVTGVLDGDPPPAGADEHAADQADGLRDARAGERVLGIADDAPHAAEIRDERLAKKRGAADVAVGELAVGSPAECRAVRLQPLAAGEGPVVGQVRPEIVGPPAVDCRRARRRGDAEPAGDDGGRVPPLPEIALGAELRVGRDDEAARDAELGRERPCRGQWRTGPERAAPDAVTERAFELQRERLPGVTVELDEHLRRTALSRRVVH